MTATQGWSDTAIARLTDTTACPACGSATLAEHRCGSCGADYSAIGDELWAASLAAVAALRERQAVLERVPRGAPVPIPARAATAMPSPHPEPEAPAFPPPRDLSASPRPGEAPASATVQSVLAVAGAGLVAVAALVFTFFNPDLTDRLARTLIVGTIAVVFLGGAWMLSRRRLQFSAEAVGALGMVFLALVIGSAADGTRAAAWTTAAIGTLGAGAVMAALAVLIRIRTWLWVSVLALSTVPLMFGLAGGAQAAVTVGALGGAFTAFAMIAAIPRVAGRFDGALVSERVTLTVAQVALVGIALISSVFTPTPGAGWWLGHSAVLAAVAVLAVLSSRHPAGGLWSCGAGGSAVAALAVLPGALDPSIPGLWLAGPPTAAAIGLILAVSVIPLPTTVQRLPLLGGALAVVAVVTLPALVSGASAGAVTLFGRTAPGEGLLNAETVSAAALGLLATAVGLAVTTALATRRTRTRRVSASTDEAIPDSTVDGARWLGDVAVWLAAAAGLVALTTPALSLGGRVAVALAAGGGVSIALAAVPRLRRTRIAPRLPLIIAAHAAVGLGSILSLRDDALIVPAGIAVVVGILLLALTVPARARFLHAGLAYAYALFVIGAALHLAGVTPLPLLCLVTAVGGVGAIAATFIPAVPPRAWWAILAVTSVPFVAGVVQVVFERSGWTALSTAVIFALALALTVTRRPGLGRQLRAASAALLVPSLAVVAVCLGAQLLAMSGSPVVLPVIAVLVATALPARLVIRGALEARIGARDAAAAVLAIEAASLLTGVIAVGLALARDSAGLGTALIVLVILAVGTAATARWAGRRYGWWVAAASATGALWCAWGLTGVTIAEPYVLPPALGAAVVGAVLVARGARGLPLYASGLGLAALPILVLLAASGTPAVEEWRAYGLVTAAWSLTALGQVLGQGRRLGPLAPVTFAAAIAAGAAGAVQGVRWGLGLDLAGTSTALIVLCLGVGVAGALPAAVAGLWLRRSVRATRTQKWPCAPAVLYVAASAWTAIERDWFVVWTMWALMLALLAGMLALAVRGRAHRTSLPPVWFVFAIAFVTAVVAWSPRDLRVEWFSLPLGLFLVAAGAVALRSDTLDPSDPVRRPRPVLDDWPYGWLGSWALLAPGIVVTLSASMASTFTDPLTWRAILVIVLALVAIIVGAARRLAAPFLLGIVVLPVENVLAFAVQIGRGIESMPWWITLSVVGAVLLTIAVTYERRSGAEAGIAARLRDLR